MLTVIYMHIIHYFFLFELYRDLFLELYIVNILLLL